jgi:ADP-sugar diphosphatase
VENEDGETLPGAVFLRGPSVAMMVTLQPDDLPEDSQDEKHVLLTVQPRIAAGTLALTELPAGMVDDGGNFAGAAAKEIKEELGICFLFQSNIL